MIGHNSQKVKYFKALVFFEGYFLEQESYLFKGVPLLGLDFRY
jgi:hypothetical protein